MAKKVVKGFKAKAYYGDQGGSADTQFTQVTAMQPPKYSVADIDTSALDDEDYVKTYTAGWGDSGEMTMTCQFKATQAVAVFALVGLDKSFKVEFADGSTMTFDGYIKEHSPAVDKEGIVTVDLTVKVSGKITLAAGSGS